MRTHKMKLYISIMAVITAVAVSVSAQGEYATPKTQTANEESIQKAPVEVVEKEVVEYRTEAMPTEVYDNNEVADVVEDTAEFPPYYGWAYDQAMSDNAMVSISAPSFIIFPYLIQGNQFVLVDPIAEKAMFAYDALGGTVFSYMHLNGAEPGYIYLGLSGGGNKYAVGLYTAINNSRKQRTNMQSTDAEDNDINWDEKVSTENVYGLLFNYAFSPFTVFGTIDYRSDENYLADGETTPGVTVTKTNDINAMNAQLGFMIPMGNHNIITSLTTTIATNQTNDKTVDKRVDPATTESVTEINLGNYVKNVFSFNYGYQVKSAGSVRIYTGATMKVAYKTISDDKLREAGSRIDAKSLDMEFIPNVSSEYLMSKYVIVFGGVTHKVLRNSSQADAFQNFDETSATGDLRKGVTDEKFELNNKNTNVNYGIRVAYGRWSVESVFGNSIFTDGTAALFNTGLQMTQTTVGVTF